MQTLQPTFTYEEAEILCKIVTSTRGDFFKFCDQKHFVSDDATRYADQLLSISLKLIPADNETVVIENESNTQESKDNGQQSLSKKVGGSKAAL